MFQCDSLNLYHPHLPPLCPQVCSLCLHLYLDHVNRFIKDFPIPQMVKKVPAMQETQVWPLGWEDPLEKGMAINSSILAWRIPRTKEPGRLHTVYGITQSQMWLKQLSTHARTLKMVLRNPSTGQQQRHRCREQTCGHREGEEGWIESVALKHIQYRM